jgi:hypothetical protein
LYFCTQIEEKWDVAPHPIIYNGYIRLIRRLFGYHINPRKLSYWSIPTNLTQILRENFGPYDKIVLLFTDHNHYTQGVSIQLYQGTIRSITDLNPSELGVSKQVPISEVYKHLVDRLGYFKVLIQLNTSLIQKIFNYLIVKRNSKNPFSFIYFISLIRKLNSNQNFGCYPETPRFMVFKQTGAVKTYRRMNKLIFDFLEF